LVKKKMMKTEKDEIEKENKENYDNRAFNFFQEDNRNG